MSAALDEAQPGIGLFLRTTAGWYLAQRGGTAIPTGAPARPIPPATVGQATRENPAINATSASLINLTRLRTVQFTAAARATAFTGMGWYIGTRGAGLLYYPNGAGLPEAMPLGLPRGVPSTLFAGPRGVWAATARSTDADAAIAFVATDLSEFRWWQGPLATGFPFAAARRMVGLGQTLWLATDAGAVKVNPREDEVRRYDIGSGLPDSRITDIAQRRGVIAIATPRGAARWHDSTGFERVAPEFAGAVDAVALEGDTTWLGTRLGLYYGVPDDPRLRQTPGFGASASFQVPVVDIAWLADTLVALTPDRLMWRLPGTDSVQLGPGLAGLGTLHTVIPAWAGVFVAGDRGVAYTPLAGTPARILRVPEDLPAPVLDVALGEAHLWVATTVGIARVALEVFAQ
jgi:hypothetical protein